MIKTTSRFRIWGQCSWLLGGHVYCSTRFTITFYPGALFKRIFGSSHSRGCFVLDRWRYLLDGVHDEHRLSWLVCHYNMSVSLERWKRSCCSWWKRVPYRMASSSWGRSYDCISREHEGYLSAWSQYGGWSLRMILTSILRHLMLGDRLQSILTIPSFVNSCYKFRLYKKKSRCVFARLCIDNEEINYFGNDHIKMQNLQAMVDEGNNVWSTWLQKKLELHGYGILTIDSSTYNCLYS